MKEADPSRAAIHPAQGSAYDNAARTPAKEWDLNAHRPTEGMKPEEQAAMDTGLFWLAFSIVGPPMIATLLCGVVFAVGLLAGWWW